MKNTLHITHGVRLLDIGVSTGRTPEEVQASSSLLPRSPGNRWTAKEICSEGSGDL
jgi:hypothetical protein